MHSMTAARVSWDPLGPTVPLPSAPQPILQLLQPHRLSASAGTAHSLLACSSYIQILTLNHSQESESIHSALHITSGKVKTSVQQSPCAFGHGDLSCAAAHRVGEL